MRFNLLSTVKNEERGDVERDTRLILFQSLLICPLDGGGDPACHDALNQGRSPSIQSPKTVRNLHFQETVGECESSPCSLAVVSLGRSPSAQGLKMSCSLFFRRTEWEPTSLGTLNLSRSPSIQILKRRRSFSEGICGSRKQPLACGLKSRLVTE
jgi:hypothetical protein